MTQFRVNDPTIIANGNAIAVEPNSVKYDDGDPETDSKWSSTGGGGGEQVISQNMEDNIAMLSFDLASTVKHLNLSRGWKKNPGKNVFEISGNASGESFSKVFTSASVKNRLENELSATGKIALVLSADPT